MGIEWRFDTGGPLHAPPAVGADGVVYVGTGDGTLLSIGPDGVLRSSYTLEGAVVSVPVIDPAGRVYVATAARRLYSFAPSGALGWQARTPSHLATDLVLSHPSGVLFGGTDLSVWAYSEHATALWHVELGAPISAGPATNGRHTVVGTAAGDVVLLEGAMKRFVVRLGAAISGIVAVFADGSSAVLAHGGLLRLDPKGATVFRRDGIAWASSADGGFAAVDAEGALVRLALDGATVSRLPLGVAASAFPVSSSSGSVYIATESGAIVIVRRSGRARSVPLAHSALHRPVVDTARRRLIAAAGGGTITVMRLED